MAENESRFDRFNYLCDAVIMSTMTEAREMPRGTLAIPFLIGAGHSIAHMTGTEISPMYNYLLWGAAPVVSGLVTAVKYAREEVGLIKAFAGVEGFVKGAGLALAAQGIGYGAGQILPEVMPVDVR